MADDDTLPDTYPTPTPAELEQAQAAATPRPWRIDGRDIDQLTDSGQGYPLDVYPDSETVMLGACEQCGSRDVGMSRADADLTCHAVNLLPAHLAQIAGQAARIAELEAEAERLREAVHNAFAAWHAWGRGTPAHAERLEAALSTLLALAQGASK